VGRTLLRRSTGPLRGSSSRRDWNPALMLCIRLRSLLLAISRRTFLSWTTRVDDSSWSVAPPSTLWHNTNRSVHSIYSRIKNRFWNYFKTFLTSGKNLSKQYKNMRVFKVALLTDLLSPKTSVVYAVGYDTWSEWACKKTCSTNVKRFTSATPDQRLEIDWFDLSWTCCTTANTVRVWPSVKLWWKTT